MRRGSYFFVIDAFIAGIIILGAVIALYSGFISQPQTTSTFFSAEDVLTFMERTRLGEYDSDLVRNWSSPTAVNGNRTNQTDLTLLQHLVLFNVTRMDTETGQLATLIGETIPEHVSGRIRVNGRTWYETNYTNGSNVFVTGKRIVVLKSPAGTIYPPAVVEVQTWQ